MLVMRIFRSTVKAQNVAAGLKTIRHYNMTKVVPPTHSALLNSMMGQQSVQVDSRTLESDFAEVAGNKLHYMRGGAGNHALLLLPGALGSAMTDFRPQLENLNKDVFSLVAWDPPGYGKSYPPERNWERHFLEKDAVLANNLMEKLGFKTFSLLGWSDGGISALILAAKFPQNVRKLVVLAANSYVIEEETKMYDSIRDIDSWSPKMRQPFVDLYGEDYFRRTWANWVDAFKQQYFIENKGDICESALAKISAPTLVIHGQKDPIVSTFHAEHLLKHVKNARLHMMPEGKHNLHLRYPKEFNSIVETFLMEPEESKI